ncbi:response regulator transcription factor [Clostridium manihotivorum]|uniref:Stage 0 sporulation protein A homolog n=1 Tax=Clostridium manihotivorum TaxID=2320868 RepID=A0A3R5U7U7_9CLOT|nr:response regulator transcription factor [Clostridium manihotivorum]QAA34124.1 DNA-binding response regulator [Clostridium manihotivorum]
MNTVLIIEDEKTVREVTKAYLEKEGYKVLTAEYGLDGLSIFIKEKVDLVILDLMLPDIQGEEICQRLRKISDVHIFMLTAKGALDEKIHGLNIGADEYLVKPFSPRELVARVNSLFRRISHKDDTDSILAFNDKSLIINTETREVLVDGKYVSLTPNEFDILYVMAKNKGKVFSREALIESVFGMDFEGYDRTIDVHIKNLRKKIERDTRNPRYIITVVKLGYKFSGE